MPRSGHRPQPVTVFGVADSVPQPSSRILAHAAASASFSGTSDSHSTGPPAPPLLPVPLRWRFERRARAPPTSGDPFSEPSISSSGAVEVAQRRVGGQFSRPSTGLENPRRMSGVAPSPAILAPTPLRSRSAVAGCRWSQSTLVASVTQAGASAREERDRSRKFSSERKFSPAAKFPAVAG